MMKVGFEPTPFRTTESFSTMVERMLLWNILSVAPQTARPFHLFLLEWRGYPWFKERVVRCWWKL